MQVLSYQIKQPIVILAGIIRPKGILFCFGKKVRNRVPKEGRGGRARPRPADGGGRARSGCLGGGVYARLHRASQPRGVQNLDRGGWGGLAAPGDGDPADQAPALEGLWTW